MSPYGWFVGRVPMSPFFVRQVLNRLLDLAQAASERQRLACQHRL
ncbi:MAG: hypothetical protein WBN68_03515 [Sedimenticolaceae bacterium]